MTTFFTLLFSASAQGILWSLLALGVYVTFRILDIADMTAEGSFPLGGGVAAISILSGIHPLVATLLGFLSGALAGGISGILHTKLKIPALLAGIITMTGLYSITSRIMGAPNLSLLGQETIFSWMQSHISEKNKAVIFVGLLFAFALISLLALFFRTEIGLAIRAAGDNLAMSEANGINTDTMKILGYMISNGCIALSGALLVQNNGFADLNSGIGTIVIGLASIIIAEVLFKNRSLVFRFVSIVVGSVIYRFILGLVFELNVEPGDTKLISALVLVLCLSLPQLRVKLRLPNVLKEVHRNDTRTDN
ncbi:MAG: ABC transporter permease [Enterococcus sp.]